MLCNTVQVEAAQIVADVNDTLELVVALTIPPADGDVFVATPLYAGNIPSSPVSSASASVGYPVPLLPVDRVDDSPVSRDQSAPKKAPPPLPPSLPIVKVLIDGITHDIKYSPSMNMGSLALQSARVSGKNFGGEARCSMVNVDDQPLHGEVLVKDYLLQTGRDSVLRLCVSIDDSDLVLRETPPKATAAVIAELLGFIVPSTPETDAFFDSLNCQLDRETIDIDSCSTPICKSHPVAPVPSSILCCVSLHSSITSSALAAGIAASSKKTFSWESSITCEKALSKASSSLLPEVSGFGFMFKAPGRFE